MVKGPHPYPPLVASEITFLKADFAALGYFLISFFHRLMQHLSCYVVHDAKSYSLYFHLDSLYRDFFLVAVWFHNLKLQAYQVLPTKWFPTYFSYFHWLEIWHLPQQWAFGHICPYFDMVTITSSLQLLSRLLLLHVCQNSFFIHFLPLSNKKEQKKKNEEKKTKFFIPLSKFPLSIFYGVKASSHEFTFKNVFTGGYHAPGDKDLK